MAELPSRTDVLIIGAGAAGLMCAAVAGQRGRDVLVLDHANKVGKKILMSGGGRCNFTNLYTSAENFYSQNRHFCKSALARYSQWDFVALVERYKIPYHEKTLGQLFCDNKSQDIVDLLLAECRDAKAHIRTRCKIQQIEAMDTGFQLYTNMGKVFCQSLVVACGGLSIPTMGASGFGFDIARQFDIKVVPTRPALVPFVLQSQQLKQQQELPGQSLLVTANCGLGSFTEQLLFTHRGLSGPAILQISSHWHNGQVVEFDLAPKLNLPQWLATQCRLLPNTYLHKVLLKVWRKRLVQYFLHQRTLISKPLKQYSFAELAKIGEALQNWILIPADTEGYRTAEVTLGGVDTNALSSQTMESKKQPGLYFIGEVLDVTGWLGGYNFQWAWASGNAAGEVV